MIGSSIYTALSGNAAVTAIVGTRIYPVVIPQTQSLPALVYSIASTFPTHTNDGPSTLDKFTFSIFCVAKKYNDVEDLAGKVRTALHGYKSSSVQSIRYQGEYDDYEVDTAAYIRVLNFTIRIIIPVSQIDQITILQPTVAETLPDMIMPGMLVIFNNTLWRGLLAGESSLPAGTPWPIKGYKELVASVNSAALNAIIQSDFDGVIFEAGVYSNVPAIKVTGLSPDAIMPQAFGYDGSEDNYLALLLVYDPIEVCHYLWSKFDGQAIGYGFDPSVIIKIRQYPPQP